MSNKFCTVQDVLALMQNADGFTRDNNLIAIFIEQATAMIRQFTRREWTAQIYTDYVSTVDVDVSIKRGGIFVAPLREKPVNVSEELYPQLRYSASGRWDDTADMDREDYTIEARKNQLIMYPGVMEHRPRSLRITYTAGYPTQDVAEPENVDADADLVMVPNNLRLACMAQAAYMTRRELNTTAGTSRESGGNRNRGYSVTSTGLVAEALALIRTETRIFVGGTT